MRKKVFVVAIVIIIVLTLLGYRISPISAIKANPFVGRDIEIIKEVKREWCRVYIVETNKGIKSTIAIKKGPLWISNNSFYILDDVIKNDKIKTLGSLSIHGEKSIAVLCVESEDGKVKYIDAGVDNQRQRVSISIQEPIIIVWDEPINLNEINAIALDEDKSKTYVYSYHNGENSKNVIRFEDLRWYPVSQGEN